MSGQMYNVKDTCLKVRQSRKQIMVPSILPKNERWDNFQYIKVYQRSFFGRIEDTIMIVSQKQVIHFLLKRPI